MKNEERKVILREHNSYRSRVALGKYTIRKRGSGLSVLPPATRMIQLKYNCSLEASALAYAHKSQCKMVHSNGNVGENLYAMGGINNFLHMAQRACMDWGDEIEYNGANAVNDWNYHIGHATQMFWDKTTNVGCGIIQCGTSATGVVCHYWPRGNMAGAHWYRAGKTLSECGKNNENEIPHSSTGLCEIIS